MPLPIVVFIIGAWFAAALEFGRLMARRGFDARRWSYLALILGPLAWATAVIFERNPKRAPWFLHLGKRGSGGIDVVVGMDGSAESRAAVSAVESLLGDRIGRLTMIWVVPIDWPHHEMSAARDRLECERRRSSASNVASTLLLRGRPAEELRAYAERLDYELIAIGSRGAGRAVGGTGRVAASLAHGTVVPVLTVNAGRDADIIAVPPAVSTLLQGS